MHGYQINNSLPVSTSFLSAYLYSTDLCLCSSHNVEGPADISGAVFQND